MIDSPAARLNSAFTERQFRNSRSPQLATAAEVTATVSLCGMNGSFSEAISADTICTYMFAHVRGK